MVSKKDPEFEPTSEVTEEERQAKMRAIEQELISKAVASLIGTEPLPALLFVNSDHQVTRVDVDQLPDERSAALLHALMGLAGRRQDMPRRRTLGQI